MTRTRICVIGAGIMGISSALRIKQSLGNKADVTIISDTFSPDTMADGSAGFWLAYQTGDTPSHLVRSWSQETLKHFLSIIGSADAGKLGAQLMHCYWLSESESIEEVDHLDLFPSYRPCTEAELSTFPYAKSGRASTSTVIDCKLYLPWIMERFQKLGGLIRKKKVNSFEEVADEFDILVNCTGVRAGHLTGDKDIIPARGQFIRVHAPWIKNIVEMGDFHVIPTCSNVALGGVFQKGNWSRSVSDTDTKTIWEGCLKIFPSLKVVHNYGHSGAGVTLHWGCAGEVAALVGNIAKNTEKPSKL